MQTEKGLNPDLQPKFCNRRTGGYSRATVYIELAFHLVLPLRIYNYKSKFPVNNKLLQDMKSYLFIFYFFLQNFGRKSEESQKEMKILLDVYKGAAKDLRDKVEVKIRQMNCGKYFYEQSHDFLFFFFPLCAVQLISAEKKLKEEIEEQKVRIENLEKELEKYKGALADEEAIKRLKMADETIEQLQKNLAATKQVTYNHLFSFKKN